MRQFSGENNAALSLPRSNRNQRMTLDRRITSTDCPRRTSSPTTSSHKANHPAAKDFPKTSDTSTESSKALLQQEKSLSTRKSSNGAPKRKRVVFNTTVRFVSTLGLHQYTDEEVRSTWFSNNEFDSMKAETRSTVKIMRKLDKKKLTKPLDPNEVCFRGLEHLRSTELLRKIQMQQRQVITSVLYAQDQSHEFGDPVTLSDVSRRFSIPTVRLAMKKGIQDALEVQDLADF